MAQALRLFFLVPLAVAIAACGASGVQGGASTSAGGAGTGSVASTGGGAMTGSSSAGGAGAGGVAGSTSSAGGAATTSSSSAGGGGAGGAAATTSTAASTSASASTTASGSTTASTGGFVCFNDADCPGPSTPCMTSICAAGACGVSFVAAGADALTQTPGDCQKAQCDGQGNVVPTLDSTDVPGAGNPCVAGSCVGGAPTLTPLTGVACSQNGGKVCNSGACVGCLSANDCPGSNDCNLPFCAAGQCHVIPDNFACSYPPPCYEGPALCTPNGCSYTIQKTTGSPCPGGVCVGAVGCTPCSQYCQPPLPCQVLVCANGSPIVTCTYPNAPQGTSCPGGTCDGNGACL